MESFWDFSVRTYRASGVHDASMSLQNDHGFDVNMVLYCCWAGATHGRLATPVFEDVYEFSAQWAGNVIAPLRAARTWMKQRGCVLESVPRDECMEYREQIKAAEFAGEKMQQEVLESLTPGNWRETGDTESRTADVVANLLLYARRAEIDVTDEVREKFVLVVRAACPDSHEQHIRQALAS